MAFVRKQGKTKIMWLPRAASVGAVAKGSLMSWNTGVLIAATNTVACYTIAGVIAKTIATTDADYAVARLIPVEVPIEKNVVWEAPADSALAATYVGSYMDLAAADDGSGIGAGSASNYDIAQCVKYISATKGWFILNIGPDAYVKA